MIKGVLYIFYAFAENTESVMKTSPYLLALFTCIFMGCGMAEVVDWGNDCPGSDSEDKLSYIGDPLCTAKTGDSCRIDNKTYDFSTNFEIKRCPTAFPICVDNKPEGVYHCEKDTKKECAETQIPCPKDDGTDEIECIDPASPRTCGATDCDSPNYGGQDCFEYGESGRCQYSNKTDKYTCRCPNKALLCGKKCIEPSDSRTCGANSCDEENYGGDNCEAYADFRDCFHTEDDQYVCLCRRGYILCDGTCINPSSDQKYCGARGACTDPDPESDDYTGVSCDSGRGVCSSGSCLCPSGQIWCIPAGSDEPRCVSPNDNEPCGARLIEGTNYCEYITCDSSQSCSHVGEEYICKQVNCPDDQQLCEVYGEKRCIPKQDPMNCGACDFRCENESRANAIGVDCIPVDDDYKCTFKCNENSTNCPPGDEVNPNCRDLQKDSKNCGSCGAACPTGKVCSAGSCIKKVCKENQCQRTDANGDPTCLNDITNCGGDCINCQTDLHAVNSECQDGVCHVTECMNNYHLSGHGCEVNSESACGPTTGQGINCITQNISKATCSATGTCVVTECKAGSHINANKTGCEANSNTACGATTSNAPIDCTKLDNVVDASCQEGKCAVTKCAAGYHLNATKTGCEANDKTACGSPVSTGQDCTKIPNSADTACEAGVCKVKKCANNYHLDSDAAQCIANSDTSCGATDSSQTTNCTTIANSASAICSGGKCVVSNCKPDYHINSNKTGCEANSNTSCAATNSSDVKNCTSGIAQYCVKGACECSTDNSLILNYEKNACVYYKCKNIPGVKDAEIGKSRCIPTACVSGYKRNYGGGWAACYPTSAAVSSCANMGYNYEHSNICCACSLGCTGSGNKCGDSGCKTGYKHYHMACLSYDVCCGTSCTNCTADGKKCNSSTCE